MFKLDPNPTFSCVVSLTVPGADTPGTVSFTFRHRGRKSLDAWIKGAEKKADADLLDEVIEGWDGVTSEQGAVEYSKARLATLLDQYPAAGGEIFRAYLAALTESRAKN